MQYFCVVLSRRQWMDPRRRMLTLGIIAGLLASVVGCSMSTPVPSSHPSHTRKAAQERSAPSPVATGEFVSRASGTTDHVTLEKHNGIWAIRLDGYSTTDTDSPDLIVTDQDVETDAACFDSGLRIDVGALAPGAAQSVELPPLDDFSRDLPAFLTNVVLTGHPDPSWQCLAEVVAVAHLHWSHT